LKFSGLFKTICIRSQGKQWDDFHKFQDQLEHIPLLLLLLQLQVVDQVLVLPVIVASNLVHHVVDLLEDIHPNLLVRHNPVVVGLRNPIRIQSVRNIRKDSVRGRVADNPNSLF
jgi:hypothetical protein